MQLTCSGMRTDHLWRDGGPTDILRARFAEPADVVTLTMGANDLIVLWHRYLIRATLLRSARHMIPAAGWRLLERRLAPERRRTLVVASGIEHRLARVLEWITDRAPDARVVITTYYVGDGGRATSTEFGRSLVEAVIAGSACGPETVAMVDLAPLLKDSASRPRLTSRVDGLHPTPAGQQVIARAVADAILRRRPETSSGPSSNPSMLPGRG